MRVRVRVGVRVRVRVRLRVMVRVRVLEHLRAKLQCPHAAVERDTRVAARLATWVRVKG